MVPIGKFFITTAIDYPSSKPHLGHCYEKIIADVIARYHRLKGYDVHFSTGLDEHGSKIEKAAEKDGKSPQEFVDYMSRFFLELCKKYNISYDDFIRTTEKRHEDVVDLIFKKVHARGDIYKGEYEGLYCVDCETFYLEKDLTNGNCPVHGKPVDTVREGSYFFRMGKYQKALVDYIEKNPDFIRPEKKRKEIINRLNDPLKDLSISRATLKWGIATPIDSEHVIYIWMDALINYLTTLGYPRGKYETHWPALHIIGSDIIWHHSVIWGTILMSAGIELPKIFVHGFINIGGEKMSKSHGEVVDPLELADKIHYEYVRYFLCRDIVLGEDGDFSMEALKERANGELVDNIANFCYRTLSFISSHGKGKVKDIGTGQRENIVMEQVSEKARQADRKYAELKINEALKHILEISDIGNRYFQENEPWVLVKKDPAKCDRVLAVSANIVKKLAILLKPITPDYSKSLEEQLGVGDLKWHDLYEELRDHQIGEPRIVFRPAELTESDPFSSLDLKVGEIISVNDVQGADRLYLLEVDIGKEKRTLVAGLKEYYKKDELMGKKIVIVANMQPATIRGVRSQGMLLAADDGSSVGILLADGNPGDSVSVEGVHKNPAKEVDIKLVTKLGITGKGGNAFYGDRKLKTAGKDVFVDRDVEGKVR